MDNEVKITNLIKRNLDEYFEPIKKRGLDYYNNKKVLSIIRGGDVFKAKVQGNDIYDVTVYISLDDGFFTATCSCPYEFPCKHSYAVLLSILNHEYRDVGLKPNIQKNDISMYDLIMQIPPEELKRGILSSINLGDDFDIDILYLEDLKEEFSRYLPSQKYEYYYNNLYNDIVFYENADESLKGYNLKLKNFLNYEKYIEAFSIIKAIIEAYNDSLKLEEINDIMPFILIDLRIIYRRSNKELRNAINKWFNKLKENNYYNNMYLEDVCLLLDDR